MDISALAIKAVSLLPSALKFLKDSGMGEAIKNSAKDYWDIFKCFFITSPGAQNTLGKLESDPGNPRLQGRAEIVVAEALAQHPELVAKLEAAIQKFEVAQAGSNTLSVEGNENPIVQGVRGNENRINQGIQQRHSGTGDNVGGNKYTTGR